jgi:ABC-type transport system involved in multi-copper enzyme maturation permease subunit
VTTGTLTRDQAVRDGFAQLVHAEWTKFRTVRGWVIAMIVAAMVIVGLGYFIASGNVCGSGPFPGQPYTLACTSPIGPGGEAVTDEFYLVHRPLAGNGSITVRVTTLAGVPGTAGLQPWSKAGIIVTAGTRPGSGYAAMMVTGGHGARMQWDYTQDVAGLAGKVSASNPRWLRLTRDGDTITGFDSADGTHWTEVGSATLAGLPTVTQAGLFATSPRPVQGSGLSNTVQVGTGGSEAAGTMDDVSLRGNWPGSGWTGTEVGAGRNAATAGQGGFQQAGGAFTVSGSGDIAPAVSGQDTITPISQTLVSTFAGLIAVITVAVMFITAEYRRGLIHLSLAASPRRGRLLAAKAVVIGAVAFAAGLAGAAVTIPLAEHVLRRNGNFIAPVSALTELRVVIGTAALLAVAAVMALAVGAMLRRSAAAVTVLIVVTVLPYLFAVATPGLPAGPANWLVEVTPAAAFAIQQTSPQYPQVSDTYAPFFGYYPLAPWAGFAVLCGWAALAFALALFLLRRRDA